ncbi:hypothetical protein B1R94_09625 [Mycolicibacterium litorale]|nr:hypothetical protein B1R94_09625 [Mycolicibacterium litorale]
MPEMTFAVRWPDGTVDHCYSPSLVMHDYLTVGARYPVPEFVSRSRAALDEATERVRAKFGFACTSAAATAADITSRAAGFHPHDQVEILDMQPTLEKS